MKMANFDCCVMIQIDNELNSHKNPKGHIHHEDTTMEIWIVGSVPAGIIHILSSPRRTA